MVYIYHMIGEKVVLDGIEFNIQKSKKGYIVSYEDYRVGTLYLYIEKLDDLNKLLKLIDNIEFAIALKDAKIVLPTNSLLRLLHYIGKNIDSLVSDNKKLEELIKEIQDKVERYLYTERTLEKKKEDIMGMLKYSKYKLFDTVVYDKHDTIQESVYGIRIILTKSGEKALLIINCSSNIINTNIFLVDLNCDIYYLEPVLVEDEKKRTNILYRTCKYLEKKDFDRLLKFVKARFNKADGEKYIEYAKYIIEIINKAYKLLEPDCNRVYSVVKFDIRKGKDNRLKQKIKSVERNIGKEVKK